MSDYLKGNFDVKNPVKDVGNVKDDKTSREKLEEKFEKAALTSIGGSMVYVRKTKLTWDGDESNE